MGNFQETRTSSNLPEIIDGGDTIEISEGHDGKPIFLTEQKTLQHILISNAIHHPKGIPQYGD